MVELHPAVVVSVTAFMALFAIITVIVTCVIRRKKSAKQNSSTNDRKNDDVSNKLNDIVLVPQTNVSSDIKVDIDDYDKEIKEEIPKGDENDDYVGSKDKAGANDVTGGENGADANAVQG